MNWYEQKTNEYQSITGKQILREFGAAGYGMYIILKQIIGEHMQDDQNEWGYVPMGETMATLAEKCGSSEADFRLFIKFCDDRFILEKRNGRLFCPSILEEKNQYAKKVERKKVRTSSTAQKCPDSTDSTDKADKSVQYDVTTQHNTITTQSHKLDKSNGSNEPEQEKVLLPREDKRNVLVNHVLSEFERIRGHKPVDKKARFVAQNLIQRLKTLTRERYGGEITDERIKKAITAFFNWVQEQDWFEKTQKLETCKDKLPIFEAMLPKGHHATNSQTDQGTSTEARNAYRGLEDGEILRGDRPASAHDNQLFRERLFQATPTRTGGTQQSMERILPPMKVQPRGIGVQGNMTETKERVSTSAGAMAQGAWRENTNTRAIRPDDMGQRGFLPAIPQSELGAETSTRESGR